MIEGSGARSVPRTNGSGAGRPKNIWIRICNTNWHQVVPVTYLSTIFVLFRNKKVGTVPYLSRPVVEHYHDQLRNPYLVQDFFDRGPCRGVLLADMGKTLLWQGPSSTLVRYLFKRGPEGGGGELIISHSYSHCSVSVKLLICTVCSRRTVRQC